MDIKVISIIVSSVAFMVNVANLIYLEINLKKFKKKQKEIDQELKFQRAIYDLKLKNYESRI